MRSSGILLPVFSLPGKYGIGCFSKEARSFIDFLKESGQKYWQILPLGPTGYGDSPYQTFSTFAGNPYFISLESLIEEGLLTGRDCAHLDRKVDPKSIDYGRLYKERFKVLFKAFENWKSDDSYRDFCDENADWLPDYTLFMALKDEFDGVSFTKWDKKLRSRDEKTLDKYRKKLKKQTEFYGFLQFKFYEQWKALRGYANEKGIEIIGDIPIYVSPDSSDLWASPELFQTDEEGNLTAVAGCPPDAFTADGQLWGNPLYDWDLHRKTGFSWWTSRIRKCCELYDVVRIDHFRGFDEYYSIPFGMKNARIGSWEKGPGLELFKAVKKELGRINVIAEDLGFITPSVRRLVKNTGFPNMKVLEFAFDRNDTLGKNEYLPHNYYENCVVYTGTHDNETLAGWWHSMKAPEKKRVRSYLDIKSAGTEVIADKMVRAALSSVAKICIIPLQDYMGLGNEARINYPSTLGGNWIWRYEKNDLTDELSDRILSLTQLYGRSM